MHCRVATVGFLALALCAIAASCRAAELVEEETFFTAEIGGWAYQLEALVVRPAAEAGRLPVALITHGSPRSAADRPKFRPQIMRLQARDLAHRGWLAVAVSRRGFGVSSGPFAEGYECQRPNFRRALATAAADIEAVRAVVSKRPDADSSRILGVGVSVGGATMLAWAAQRPPGLVAVVNISGGTGSSAPGLNCDESGLVSTFATFGSEARVPSIWLYSENDSFLPAGLVRRMHGAFTESGGSAELHMFGPLERDGHDLFALFDGRLLWLTELDRFLREHRLPTWDPEPLAALAAKLGPGPNRVLARFLSAPTEKAIAVSQSGQIARWWGGEGNLEAARRKSREACERVAGEPCRVIAENFTPVDGR